LLATLNPADHLHARRALEWPLERMRAGWHALVDALAAAPGARTQRSGDDRKPTT
jgi:hypothetical protein